MITDQSLAAHFLAEVYEQQPDVEAFVSSLYEGTADLANNEKFNSLMDFFDVMMENNYAKDSAIAAERETTEMMLAEGQIAFMIPVGVSIPPSFSFSRSSLKESSVL